MLLLIRKNNNCFTIFCSYYNGMPICKKPKQNRNQKKRNRNIEMNEMFISFQTNAKKIAKRNSLKNFIETKPAFFIVQLCPTIEKKKVHNNRKGCFCFFCFSKYETTISKPQNVSALSQRKSNRNYASTMTRGRRIKMQTIQ